MKSKFVPGFDKDTYIYDLSKFNSNNRGGLFIDFQFTGYENVNEKYIIVRENFESILLSYHVSGKSNIIIDGKDYYVFNSDYLLILDCQRKLETYVNKGESFKMIYIHFYNPMLKEYINNLTKETGPLINLNNDKINFKQTILEIHEDYENNRFDSVKASSKIYELLMRLENYIKSMNIKNTNNPKFIDDAISYITHNYKENIDLASVANYIGFDKCYLERSFKKYMNDTIGKYIAKIRLEKAKEILLNTNKKLDEIALDIGLNDAKSLIRLFNKYLDITPKEYKNKNMGYDFSQIEIKK